MAKVFKPYVYKKGSSESRVEWLRRNGLGS